MSGVAFNEPPSNLLASIERQIQMAATAIPAGARGALVGVATESGVNAALVIKAGHGWDTVTWIGKSWGAPIEGGAMVRKVLW
jgi:hypothetical protein